VLFRSAANAATAEAERIRQIQLAEAAAAEAQRLLFEEMLAEAKRQEQAAWEAHLESERKRLAAEAAAAAEAERQRQAAAAEALAAEYERQRLIAEAAAAAEAERQRQVSIAAAAAESERQRLAAIAAAAAAESELQRLIAEAANAAEAERQKKDAIAAAAAATSLAIEIEKIKQAEIDAAIAEAERKILFDKLIAAAEAEIIKQEQIFDIAENEIIKQQQLSVDSDNLNTEKQIEISNLIVEAENTIQSSNDDANLAESQKQDIINDVITKHGDDGTNETLTKNNIADAVIQVLSNENVLNNVPIIETLTPTKPTVNKSVIIKKDNTLWIGLGIVILGYLVYRANKK
jgi:hypothetical protein